MSYAIPVISQNDDPLMDKLLREKKVARDFVERVMRLGMKYTNFTGTRFGPIDLPSVKQSIFLS